MGSTSPLVSVKAAEAQSCCRIVVAQPGFGIVPAGPVEQGIRSVAHVDCIRLFDPDDHTQYSVHFAQIAESYTRTVVTSFAGSAAAVFHLENLVQLLGAVAEGYPADD